MKNTALMPVEVWSNKHAIKLRHRSLHKVMFQGEQIGSFTTAELIGHTTYVDTRKKQYEIAPTHAMSNSYSVFEGRREVYRLIPKGFFSAFVIGREGARYKLKLAGMVDWAVLLVDTHNNELILEHKGSAISESKTVQVASMLLEEAVAVPLIALIYHYRDRLKM